MTISGTIDLDRQKRQEKSTTLSSSGSVTVPWKVIRKGLEEAVWEYLQALPVSTLPHPEFPMDGLLPSSSSIQIEEGLCQMSDIVTVMLEQALLDQGSQGFRKSAWKTTPGKIITPKRWEREEDSAGNILFYYPEFFGLPLDS